MSARFFYLGGGLVFLKEVERQHEKRGEKTGAVTYSLCKLTFLRRCNFPHPAVTSGVQHNSLEKKRKELKNLRKDREIQDLLLKRDVYPKKTEK